jgi:oligopeptidase A
MPDNNPFLDRRFDIQWSRLTPALVAPAIEAALADALGALERIATQDRPAVTFASSIEALEAATDALNEAWGKVVHINSVCDSPELRGAYNAMLPKVTEFYASIHLNGALWDVMKAFASTPEASTLKGVRKRLLDETIADFKQAGADLDPAKKARLEQIESELAALTQKYSENVLDATNAWEMVIDDESAVHVASALAGAGDDPRARRGVAARGVGGRGRRGGARAARQPRADPAHPEAAAGEGGGAGEEGVSRPGARAADGKGRCHGAEVRGGDAWSREGGVRT